MPSYYDVEMVNKVGRLTVSKNYDARRNDYTKRIANVAYLHTAAQMKYSTAGGRKNEEKLMTLFARASIKTALAYVKLTGTPYVGRRRKPASRIKKKKCEI